jgi:glycosyltransferase involved in cell wall biosynthesis
MDMKTSQVALAAAEYAKGNYFTAIEIYKRLGQQIGMGFFEANIRLCERHIGLTTLKRYSQKQILNRKKKSAVSAQEIEETNEIFIAHGKNFEIKNEVKPATEYHFLLKCKIEGATNSKAVVADVSFYDEDGNLIQKPYAGMANSSSFGAWFYIEANGEKDLKAKSYPITTTKTATRVSIKLLAFGAKEGVTIFSDYVLRTSQELGEDAVVGSKYLEVFNEVIKEAEAIPDSNGSEYFTKHDYKVGIIGDIYMLNFYKDVFTTVHYLSPDNYQDVLDTGLDIVIYTTCWKGINNEEWRGVKFRKKPNNALDGVLEYAKKNGIKTVFQSIEDPSNFEYFLPIAEKFDYVLTTDIDCIPLYKEKLGHDRVFFGEYGVNPQFNNPIGCRRNIRNAAFFAGSYSKRYQERCTDMEIIFDSIVDSGGELLIADRNFGAESQDLVYPVRLQSSVLPPVQHAVLQKLHKLFRYNLNFNSIKQSPTMCAMRVYELQAQGNGLISNYANSVFNKFPGIRIVPFKQNMRLDFCRDENWEEYRLNISNVREVLNDKTSYQVVGTLLSNIGLARITKQKKTIAVICKKKTDQIVKSFTTQSYPDKVLLLESELDLWEDIKIKNDVGYFCWFNSTNSYEKNYLNDLINAFKYTDCEYITKNGFFSSTGKYIFGKEHEYTDKCSGKSISLFSAKYLNPGVFASLAEDQSFDWKNGYSIDPFEVNFINHIKLHKTKVDNYRLSVIVPVHNNGRFLTSKCLPSLQRNKVWPYMEIILVDDGSTDNNTLEAVHFLEALYSNVRVKFNNDGGSGSASRARNQGLNLATAELITFLDPDNEISPGAYDLLLDLYTESNTSSNQKVEFVSGFHVKVAEDVKVIGKHTAKQLSIVKDFKAGYFDRGRFPVIATQSAVIEKRFLDEKNIRFVERSAGQDTLFGWELIAKATCGAFSGEPYIIYYAERNGSITNVIDIGYFEKKLILERSQVSFLKEFNFFENFRVNHFDKFMTDWYLNKLKYVTPADYGKSISILAEICDLYNKDIKDFLSL